MKRRRTAPRGDLAVTTKISGEKNTSAGERARPMMTMMMMVTGRVRARTLNRGGYIAGLFLENRSREKGEGRLGDYAQRQGEMTHTLT